MKVKKLVNKRGKIFRELVLLFLFLSFISPSLAVKHIDRQHNPEWLSRQQPPLNRLKKWLSSLSPATMVGGKICSKYPDEEHTCDPEYQDCTYVRATCPSNLSGGCAIVFWGPDGQFLKEEKVGPGEHAYYYDKDEENILIPAVKINYYYCNKNCKCSSYTDQGCGSGPCGREEMYRIRNCTSHWVEGVEKPCQTEKVCVSSDECEVCTVGTFCKSGDVYRRQTDCNEYMVKRCGDSEWQGEWRRYCKNGNVYKKRKVIDRGCAQGNCYEKTSTQNKMVKRCGAKVCRNGNCVPAQQPTPPPSPPPSPGVIQQIINFFRSLFGLSSGRA